MVLRPGQPGTVPLAGSRTRPTESPLMPSGLHYCTHIHTYVTTLLATCTTEAGRKAGRQALCGALLHTLYPPFPLCTSTTTRERQATSCYSPTHHSPLHDSQLRLGHLSCPRESSFTTSHCVQSYQETNQTGRRSIWLESTSRPP